MQTDVDLYVWIVNHLQAGGNYYDVWGYAMRHGPNLGGSIFNWRPPLLYLVLAWWPWPVTNSAGALLFSELWAGLAIVSASLSTKTAPKLSIGLATLAGLLRELALPYVLIRAVLGYREHKTAWRTAAFLLGLYYVGHWANVLHAQLPTDHVGPPWLAFQGLRFLAVTVSPNPFTVLLGRTGGAYAWIGALAGTTLLKQVPVADRLTLGLYLLAFLVVGRAEQAHTNAYWGFMLLPLQAVTLWKVGIGYLDRWLVTQRPVRVTS